jgi:hypothetical protein
MAEPDIASDALSADALARRFRLRERARADAAEGASASRAEDDVRDAVRARRERVEAARRTLAERVEQDLRRLAPLKPDFEGACAQARLSLRLIAGRLAAEFQEARKRAARTASELDGFRRVHDLRRPAIYPESRMLQAGLLVFAAGFEALFSAALFAETDEHGLMGGAMTALGLSAANVSLGFLAGFLGLRYLGHARMAPRILGGLALTILFALSASLNLFAAAWRDRLSAGDLTALDRLNDAQWFGLIAPQAVILLMLGAGVWVFSTLKGYSGFDDPYPDYGKLDRAVRDAAETVSARRAAAREALEAPIEQARSLIEAQLAAAAAAVARVRARYDEACADLQAMEAETRRADDAAAGAIEIYRRERLAHSNGHEPPVFATLPPSAPFTDALARAADVRLAAEQEIAAMQAQATAKLEELSRELDAISARLEGDS